MVSYGDLVKMIEKWELVNVEFKSRRFLIERDTDSHPELAAQLTSLANRVGGHLVFGVDDAARRIEEGRFDEREDIVQWIAHVNRDRCSPPTEISHEFVDCPEGEVLVLFVRRRSSMPHAVVERRGGQIRDRTYYIRNNQGKQLVGDVELQQMFLNADYPELSLSFPFAFSYTRDPPGGFFFRELPSRTLSDAAFITAFQDLTKEQLGSFRKQEADNATRLVSELFPYAVLSVLSRRHPADLGMKVVRLGLAEVIEPNAGTGMTLGSADIPEPPDGSLLASIYPQFEDFSRTLLVFGDVTLPPDSGVEVSYEGSPSRSSSLILRGVGTYELRVTYRGGGAWSVGLPLGHPMRFGHGMQMKANEPIASVYGNVELVFTIDFGRSSPETQTDYYAWAKEVFRVLEQELSWDMYMRELPSPYVLRIDRTTREILQRLLSGISSAEDGKADRSNG
jgi:hypothetical protein